MPYKDPQRRREFTRDFQREWHRRRKREFFEGKVCEDCGKGEPWTLVLSAKDYISLRKLTGGTNPWSLAQDKFDEFVARYVVIRCLSCRNKHLAEYRKDRVTKLKEES